MQFPDARLLIFSKPPRAGHAKTRLAPLLGAAGAARLQGRLTRRVVRLMDVADLCPIELWVAGEPAHPLFRALSSGRGVSLHPQQGADLGARMAHAAQQALQHSGRVVLIGSDCPLLTAQTVATAFAALRSHDAVLGPAEDGGYVLLGLRRMHMELFRCMPWGSARVAELTRGRLRGLGWSWAELPTHWDLDRPEDLPRLRSALPRLIPSR